MALSDEVLQSKDKLRRLRSRLRSIAIESEASAAFLVDEQGDPFATVGHVEFQFPHPLAGLFREGEADQILGALVGESSVEGERGSRYLVEPVGPRALLVIVAERPVDAAARAVVRSRAAELAALLGPSSSGIDPRGGAP
ncbi:MAG: hypothetical protein ACRD21_19825 [Vicinamibacteria bacterium]